MKFNKLLSALLLFVLLFSGLNYNAEAASAPIGVKWGNSILIKGQIGKLTILSDTSLLKLDEGKLIPLKQLKKGMEYRVYSYKDQNGGLYGLGGSTYVKKTASVKYETPSKIKRDQIARITFFDRNLVLLAEKGTFKGQAISFARQEDLTDVYDLYGSDPEWKGYYDGGLGRKFGNYVYYTTGEMEDELTAIDWWNDGLVPITPYIIRSTVGKPTKEGIDEMTGNWYMYYECGEYSLYFSFVGNNRSELELIRMR